MNRRRGALTSYVPPLAARRARFTLGALVLSLSLVACDDDSFAPGGANRDEFAIIVNSIEVSLSVVDVDDASNARTIGLSEAGSPVTLATRNDLVVVPLGFFPAAAVVDLRTDSVISVPLPENSGATGVAFFDDSIAYIANSNLNTVTRINALTGTTGAEIPVGTFPNALVASGERLFVLNAELDENFLPAREGTISVIAPSTGDVVSTIELSGLNPSDGELGPDGMLYVLNSGEFGGANGSLSIVDVSAATELEHHEGFGEFPGDLAFGTDGNLYVGAFSFGVAIWDAAADSFIRAPDDPLILAGNMTSSGVGFDSEGRLYSLIAGDCIAPSVAIRTDTELEFDQEITVGVCPFGIGFANVAR